MLYALISDLHSDYINTKKVLDHIQTEAPTAKILCLGDLFECKIGKRKAQKIRNAPLEEAVIITDKFESLLTFPSIIGNQEERIALVTGNKRFLQYPEKLEIEGATLLHGHQFDWDEDFNPTFPRNIQTELLFFGHSHAAAIYINEERLPITYNKPLLVKGQPYQINVGPVVHNKEWCLYDSTAKTIQFFRA